MTVSDLISKIRWVQQLYLSMHRSIIQKCVLLFFLIFFMSLTDISLKQDYLSKNMFETVVLLFYFLYKVFNLHTAHFPSFPWHWACAWAGLAGYLHTAIFSDGLSYARSTLLTQTFTNIGIRKWLWCSLHAHVLWFSSSEYVY